MNHTIKHGVTILGFLTAVIGAAVVSTDANAYAQLTRRVDAFSSKTFTYRADPGELFQVRISGDGDTDLDLFVRDEDGHIVCSRTGSNDEESCTVRASSFGGSYRVEVRNLGEVYNTFRLVLR